MPQVFYQGKQYEISDEADEALANYGDSVMAGEMESEVAIAHILRCEKLIPQHTSGPAGECGCGAPLEALKELFGEDIQGHIVECKKCGGDLHVDEGCERCLSCGHQSRESFHEGAPDYCTTY